MNGYAPPHSQQFYQPDSVLREKNKRRLNNRILRRNEHLIRAGDEVRQAYVVVSGVLKSYIDYENGDSQVLGFHTPGEIIGYEYLLEGRSYCAVIALDTSCIRKLRSVDAQKIMQESGSVQQALIKSMYAEIQRLTRQLYLERECSTAARLATFLLDYLYSQAERGYSRHDFILPMCRKDLAGYLGLATETLSRLFGRLRDEGVLSISRNHVVILDEAKLEAVSGVPTARQDRIPFAPTQIHG